MDYPLLSDTDKKVATSYGILNRSGMSKRVTFVIGEDGKIAHIFDPVKKLTSHGADIAAKLKELKVKPAKKAKS